MRQIVYNKSGTRGGFERTLKLLKTSWACPGLLHDLRRSGVHYLERAGNARSAAIEWVGHWGESMYPPVCDCEGADDGRAGVELAKYLADGKVQKPVEDGQVGRQRSRKITSLWREETGCAW